MNLILVDTIGWIGASISLYAYYMVSSRRLSGTSFRFQALNIGSAMALLLNAAYHHAMPSAVVNLVWIGIAIFSLLKYRTAN